MFYREALKNTRIYDLNGDFEAVYYRLGWKTEIGETTLARCDRGQSENYEKYRTRTIQKAKSKIRRLIQRYCLDRFVTLTFADNVQDVREADKEFRKFMKRIIRRHPDFIYIAVREFQKRGAVHYHMAVNTFVEQQALTEIWGHGHVWIEKKKGEPRKMFNYLSKYITKYADDKRLKGLHIYLRSQGLVLPCQDKFFNSAEEMLDHLNKTYPENMAYKVICEFEEGNITWVG